MENHDMHTGISMPILGTSRHKINGAGPSDRPDSLLQKKYLFHTLILLLYFFGGTGQLRGQVSGTVLDTEGEALVGVNVILKDTDTGTSTDLDGKYELASVPPDGILLFSYVGYQSREVPVNNNTVINVILTSNAELLDEVIVVGYGMQKKSQVTGAIASISKKDIREIPVSDLSEALQGRASGLMALSAGNRPGQGATIRIRGNRSLTASNEPLYVVDGIPFEGAINDLNPRDIESIEILKDASATAIYGSRGANGVVLITTARGGDHKTVVSYSGQSGITSPRNLPNMMNAKEYVEVKRISGRPFLSVEERAIEKGVNTDWMDLALSNGAQHNHQLSIRGGNAQTRFALSGNYFNEKGVIKTQDFTRYTMRLNLDHQAFDWLEIGTSAQVSRQIQNWGSNLYSQMGILSPLGEPFDEEGNPIAGNMAGDPRMWNIMTDFIDGAYVDERTRLRVFNNLFATAKISQHLNLRINFGTDLQEYRRGQYQGSESSAREGQLDRAAKDHNRAYSTTLENILTYSRSFSEIHELTATGLFSIQTAKTEGTLLEVEDLPYQSQLFHNLGTGTTIRNLGSSLTEWGLMSYMGRVNYQLKDRYMFTLTGRFDGSSRLAAGRQWGFFPSVGLGWNVTEEPFLADRKYLSDLKIRVSYGVAGNTAISPYQTFGGLSLTSYAFGDDPAFGFRPTGIPNPDLRWETSQSLNTGVDFSLLENRIYGSVEYYITHTRDLMLQRNLPVTSGYSSIVQNIGKTQNHGYEINITTRNLDRKEWEWVTSFNLFGHRESILDLYGDQKDDPGNEWFINEPLKVFYDYDKIGIWQLDEADQAAKHGMEPGQIKVRDVNGDGVLNEQDRVILGSSIPAVNLGLNNRVFFREWEFSFLLFASAGHTVYNSFYTNNTPLTGRYNSMKVDYWTEDHPTNDHPKPNSSFENPLYGSTRGYFKGDFLKLRNVQLAYNFPLNRPGWSWASQMRVYVNVTDPWLISSLPDRLDPESYGGSIGLSNQPNTRLMSLGVQIDL